MPDFLHVWPSGSPVGGGQPLPTPGFPPAPAPVTGAGARTWRAAHALSGHRLVAAQAGRVRYPDLEVASDAYALVGITVGATEGGAEVEVLGPGDTVTEPSWNWLPEGLVYAGAQGRLTQTPPVSGWLMIVGVAQTPHVLLIRPQPPIHL